MIFVKRIPAIIGFIIGVVGITSSLERGIDFTPSALSQIIIDQYRHYFGEFAAVVANVLFNGVVVPNVIKDFYPFWLLSFVTALSFPEIIWRSMDNFEKSVHEKSIKLRRGWDDDRANKIARKSLRRWVVVNGTLYERIKLMLNPQFYGLLRAEIPRGIQYLYPNKKNISVDDFKKAREVSIHKLGQRNIWYLALPTLILKLVLCFGLAPVYLVVSAMLSSRMLKAEAAFFGPGPVEEYVAGKRKSPKGKLDQNVEDAREFITKIRGRIRGGIAGLCLSPIIAAGLLYWNYLI